MAKKTKKTEAAQVEGAQVEGGSTTEGTTEAKPAKVMPIHAEASKLDGQVRNALRPGFKALWTVKGINGLFKFKAGCKADTPNEVPEGQVVVQYPNDNDTVGHAILERDTETEAVLRPILAAE